MLLLGVLVNDKALRIFFSTASAGALSCTEFCLIWARSRPVDDAELDEPGLFDMTEAAHSTKGEGRRRRAPLDLATSDDPCGLRARLLGPV
jgi:hypothetical protein